MTPILSIDLGTITGWAMLCRDGKITSGTFDCSIQNAESGGVRLWRFKRWLSDTISLGGLTANYGFAELPTYECGIVAYELPFTLLIRRPASVDDGAI